MNCEQINALNRFALTHKRGWKSMLNHCWWNASYPAGTSDTDRALLQQLRNSGGPSILATFRPRTEGFKQVAFLKQDHTERVTLKRGWFVTAWRLVSETGSDLVQPWSASKSEARGLAEQLGIFIAGQH